MMFYWNPKFEKWEPVENSSIIKDGDGIRGNDNIDGGFVVGHILKLGLYGIFFKTSKSKAVTGLSNVRVFPNPFRPSKPDGGYDECGIVLDRLPENISNIEIYNIAGDLIAALGNSIELFDPGVPSTCYGNIDSTNYYAIWNIKSDRGINVTSGIYIYIIKTPTETKVGKLAVIR